VMPVIGGRSDSPLPRVDEEAIIGVAVVRQDEVERVTERGPISLYEFVVVGPNVVEVGIVHKIGGGGIYAADHTESLILGRQTRRGGRFCSVSDVKAPHPELRIICPRYLYRYEPLDSPF